MTQNTALLGLVRYRQIPWPTWKGLLLLVVLIAGICYFGSEPLYTFLSPTKPIGEGLLVVEGWIPDYAVREALNRFRSGRYTMIVTTGVPIETGHFLTEYVTTADAARATLLKLGAPAESLYSAPAQGDFPRDRTLASAVALDEWLKTSGIRPHAADVVTLGSHARRTRMLFQHALGDSIAVGVIAVPESSYGPGDWWKTSAGVKDVLGEVLGYLYTTTGITTLPRKK